MKFLLSLFVAMAVSAVAFAQDEKRTITVSGSGSVSAVPDLAYIRLGVVSEHAKVSVAVADNKKSVTGLLETLKTLKVDEKDVATTDYRLEPRYKYVQNEEPKLTGYIVASDFSLTVRNLNKLGSIVDSLTSPVADIAGVNRVSGIVLDVSDKTAILDKAREQAVADALRKANLLAKAAGVTVDKVVSIVETEDYRSSTPNFGVARLSESGTIAKGEKNFRVNVSLVVSIK